MEFLSNNGLLGLIIGICTFLIIGLFHPIVIKCEYYFGTKCWWWFLILGIGGVIASILIKNILLSALLGVFAFSSFWTILEIFEQKKRHIPKKCPFLRLPQRNKSTLDRNVPCYLHGHTDSKNGFINVFF